jgi:hypothetical protein
MLRSSATLVLVLALLAFAVSHSASPAADLTKPICMTGPQYLQAVLGAKAGAHHSRDDEVSGFCRCLARAAAERKSLPPATSLAFFPRHGLTQAERQRYAEAVRLFSVESAEADRCMRDAEPAAPLQ